MITHQSIRDQGYTLFEIFVSLTIIATVAAIGLPAIISQVPKMRLKIESREIVEQMQLARYKAVNTNREHRVVFTNNTYPQADSYRVERDDTGNWGGTPIIVKKETKLYRDANIYADTFPSSYICEFNTNGTSSSGSIFLNLKDTNEKKYQISVSASTGKITLEEITDN